MVCWSSLAAISVIVPAFNAARYLPEAVASIHEQTCAPLEIIVIDDGSTDETPEVVRALGNAVVSIRQSNLGIGAARNRGVEAARGNYLAFLDADDLFMPGKLARQLAHLRGEGGPDISFGCVEEFVDSDPSRDQASSLVARVGARGGGVPGAMLISRADFLRVGVFDVSWRVGEFADWYMRAMDAGLRAETLDEVVLRRRLHGDNVGIRERASRADFARIMKRALDRRKQAAAGSETP